MDQRDTLLLATGFAGASLEDWHARVEALLKGASFEERLVTHTADGVRYAPLYTRLDGEPVAQPGTSRGRRWDVQQLLVESDAGKAHGAIEEELAGGATTVVLQISASRQFGLEPGDIGHAIGEFSGTGPGISLQSGDAFPDAANALLAHWTATGARGDACRGSLNADPLGAMAAAGGLSRTLDSLLACTSQLISDTQKLRNVTAAIADGRPYHAGGAGAALELALMLSSLVAYLRRAEADGIDPGVALPKIAIGLGAHTDQLIVVAKLRAARRLVWRIGDVAGCGDATSAMRLDVTTSWRMLTRIEPETNILRSAIAASAAAMGGADGITVLPHTWALGPPDAFARRVARNTQLILMHEAQLARVADPAAGAYALEHLTEDIAHRAWSLFQEIEGQGGMAAALRSGFVQDRVQAAAERRRELVASGRRAITGTTAFATGGNLGPAIRWPAQQAATFAETVGRLSFVRDGEPFEQLRERVDVYERTRGARPVVFLAQLGTRRDFGARADFARNALAAGGFDVMASDEGFTASGATGSAFAQSGASIAVVASSDEVLEEIGEATVMALRSAGASHVLIAAKPGAQDDDLRRAGADDYFHQGLDIAAALGALLDRARVQ
ncbi:MAG: hypothetical protein RLZ98_2021 [Pseudomonadota bacterium]|jgi:methylmalonyl-CoA mutase